MRPDGQGTDEIVEAGQRRKPSATPSLERDLLKVAVVFALIAVIGWGALYLSKRAYQPDQSGASALQQTP